MKNHSYIVPAKNGGLLVKLCDWKAPEIQQGEGGWTHWDNSTTCKVYYKTVLTTFTVFGEAKGQMKLSSLHWRCIKSAQVPIMPGLWCSFPMSWQKEAGSLQGAWLDSDQCGLTTDSSQDRTSFHVGKEQTTVKLPLHTQGLGIRLGPQWAWDLNKNNSCNTRWT